MMREVFWKLFGRLSKELLQCFGTTQVICVLCDFICLSMHCDDDDDDDDDDVDDEDEDEDERSILANWGKKYHCFFCGNLWVCEAWFRSRQKHAWGMNILMLEVLCSAKVCCFQPPYLRNWSPLVALESKNLPLSVWMWRHLSVTWRRCRREVGIWFHGWFV